MRQYYFVLVMLSVLLAACSTDKTGSESITEKAPLPLVGSDIDEQGCKASAGETWSDLKQVCLRIFEQGIRLNPNDATLDQTLSAFALFDGTDDTKVELFMPRVKDSKILSKTADNNWSFNDLILSKEGKQYRLILDGKAFYQSE